MPISSLKNQKEFDLVSKAGKNLYSRNFIAVIAKNWTSILHDKPNILYFGMKVGKKLGNAVVRNKIKRRIRHLAMLLSKKRTSQSSSGGMIIIPRKGFEKVQFSTLLKDIENIF